MAASPIQAEDIDEAADRLRGMYVAQPVRTQMNAGLVSPPAHA